MMRVLVVGPGGAIGTRAKQELGWTLRYPKLAPGIYHGLRPG
jgi:hypothetical protein